MILSKGVCSFINVAQADLDKQFFDIYPELGATYSDILIAMGITVDVYCRQVLQRDTADVPVYTMIIPKLIKE